MHIPSTISAALVATVFYVAGPAVAQDTHRQHPSDEALSIPESQRQQPATPADFGHVFTDPPSAPEDLPIDWSAAEVTDASISQTYTLDGLLSLAAQYNPTIRQARLHINATLAQAMQAGLYPNPVATYAGEQIGVAGTAGEWQGGTVRQRIVTAGKLRLSRNKYQQRARVAEHLAVSQQFRVCNDVRIHFYEALAAIEIMEMKQELLKTAEDNLATVREMYNLGQANRADIHRANTGLQQHRLAVMMARNDVRRQSLTLASLVGLGPVELVFEGVLQSDRELIDFDAAFIRLVSESPEMAAAHAKLHEDSMTVAREKVEWIPDLVVSGGSGYNFERNETVGAAGLSVEIPLFDRNQGTIDQAQADWNRQRAEIRRTELRLQRDLSSEFSHYLTAVQHVMNYEAVVLPESREAYRLALTGYKENREEWPQVLIAQGDYINHRVEYIRQQLVRRTSELLIDGYLLHGGLDAAAGATPPGHIDSTPKPR